MFGSDDVDDGDVDDLEQRGRDDRNADDDPAQAVLDDRAFVFGEHECAYFTLTYVSTLIPTRRG